MLHLVRQVKPTANYDTDDIYAPRSTDETVLLVHGTLTGWSNSTTTTVTEIGSGTAMDTMLLNHVVNFGYIKCYIYCSINAIQDSMWKSPFDL